MSLDSIPDRFDAATHDELDRAVDKAVEDDLNGVSELSSNFHYIALLDAIIEHSNGHLDRTHSL